MQFAAQHQAPGDVGRLQRRTLCRRMGGKIAGNGYEDVPTLTGVAPPGELADPRLQHLIGMEARILAQQRTAQCGDQCL